MTIWVMRLLVNAVRGTWSKFHATVKKTDIVAWMPYRALSQRLLLELLLKNESIYILLSYISPLRSYLFFQTIYVSK